MSTNDIFENLVSSITEKVLEQVQHQAQNIVADAVNQRIQTLVDNNYISKAIDERINVAVAQYKPDMTVIDQTVQQVVAQVGNGVVADMNDKMIRSINEKVSEIDLPALITSHISSRLNEERSYYAFPDKSINAAAIDITNLKISGNNIVGGVIQNFGSTGIDDQSTGCKVTILDQGTVFENTLYAPKIEIKGGAIIDGDLDIQGRFVNSSAYQQLVADVSTVTHTTMTDDILKQHQNLIFERIQSEGIDLNKVTFNGKVLVNDDRLVGVVNSQLRTVGVLQDLQTRGETFLSETLYSSSRRVGINTMDPKTALSVWDEEVEISIGKTQKGVGRIASERDCALVLSSNNQNNITLKPDGTTIVKNLQLNNMTFTTSQNPPSHNAQKGAVVFNENPSLGGPIGWVSLGDARWANFGIID
jgi:hypothetical protein